MGSDPHGRLTVVPPGNHCRVTVAVSEVVPRRWRRQRRVPTTTVGGSIKKFFALRCVWNG